MIDYKLSIGSSAGYHAGNYISSLIYIALYSPNKVLVIMLEITFLR